MFKQILKPMLLKEIEKPFNSKDYIYELKYDGIRVLIYASNKDIKIITRNGNDVTSIYPELGSIKNIVGSKKVIFDGEIIAFKNNVPSFSELQKRSHLKDKSKIKIIKEEIPVCFIVFDIVYLNKDLTNKSLIERKEILNTFKDTNYFIKTNIYDNGIKLFQNVKKLGLEGIVAKLKISKYIPGKRVDTWIKIKNFKKEYFYIYGYRKLKEKYDLYLGEYKYKKFRIVGKVSVTKDNKILELIRKQKIINTKENINYINPKEKILVYYMEKLDNNLRQPFVKSNLDK